VVEELVMREVIEWNGTEMVIAREVKALGPVCQED
jgi:hypothetical protein